MEESIYENLPRKSINTDPSPETEYSSREQSPTYEVEAPQAYDDVDDSPSSDHTSLSTGMEQLQKKKLCNQISLQIQASAGKLNLARATTQTQKSKFDTGKSKPPPTHPKPSEKVDSLQPESSSNKQFSQLNNKNCFTSASYNDEISTTYEVEASLIYDNILPSSSRGVESPSDYIGKQQNLQESKTKLNEQLKPSQICEAKAKPPPTQRKPLQKPTHKEQNNVAQTRLNTKDLMHWKHLSRPKLLAQSVNIVDSLSYNKETLPLYEVEDSYEDIESPSHQVEKGVSFQQEAACNQFDQEIFTKSKQLTVGEISKVKRVLPPTPRKAEPPAQRKPLPTSKNITHDSSVYENIENIESSMKKDDDGNMPCPTYENLSSILSIGQPEQTTKKMIQSQESETVNMSNDNNEAYSYVPNDDIINKYADPPSSPKQSKARSSRMSLRNLFRKPMKDIELESRKSVPNKYVKKHAQDDDGYDSIIGVSLQDEAFRNYRWYSTDSKEAKQILMTQSQEGLFFVTKSSKSTGYTLLVYHRGANDGISKLRIVCDGDGNYSLGMLSQKFVSLPELVLFYRQHAIQLGRSQFLLTIDDV